MRSDFNILIFLLIVSPAVVWATDVKNGLLPSQIAWTSGLLSIYLFLNRLITAIIARRHFKTYGAGIVTLFLMVAGLSAIWNESHPLAVALTVRIFLSYYLLFLAVINMDLDENQQRALVKVVYWIFLLQIPVAIVKATTIGVGETPLSLVGHSATTFVFLCSVSFLLAHYLLVRPEWRYLALVLAFLGVTVVGGKRAPLFLAPFVVVFEIWFLRRQFSDLFRLAVIAAIATPIAFYITARAIPTLNPDREVWGRFDPTYPFEYAATYTTRETKEAGATGRAAATRFVFSDLSQESSAAFLIGRGPGYILKSRFGSVSQNENIGDRSGVKYGLNGMTWMMLQVGFLGAALWFMLFVTILRMVVQCFHLETDPFWKACALGMIACCFIFSAITYFYGRIYNDPSFSPLFFSMAAVSYRRWEQLTFEQGGHTNRVPLRNNLGDR